MSRILIPYIGRRISKDVLRGMRGETAPLIRNTRGKLILSANLQYRDGFLNKGEKPVSQPNLVRFTDDLWMNSIEKVIGNKRYLSDVHVEQILNKADFWSRDAERGALLDYAKRDDRVGRWARVDFQPPSCPFCTILISRGAVYKSKNSAGVADGAKFHTGCTCTVVLVRKGDTEYEGSDQVAKALKEYKDAIEATGGVTGLSEIQKAIAANRDPEPSSKPKLQFKDQAIKDVSSKLDKAQSQLSMLNRVTPKSDAAKKHTATRITNIQKLISELNTQLDTLKGP